MGNVRSESTLLKGEGRKVESLWSQVYLLPKPTPFKPFIIFLTLAIMGGCLGFLEEKKIPNLVIKVEETFIIDDDPRRSFLKTKILITLIRRQKLLPPKLKKKLIPNPN